jgi:hypothetical protein
MDGSRSKPWALAALVAGVAYFVVGKVFALPPDHLRAWRLAAWAVSAVVYAVHIAYEHFRLRSSALVTSLHVALAAALGGFLLAVAGMVNSLRLEPTIKPLWLVALVAWPLITGVPACLVALVGLTLFGWMTRRVEAR